MSDAVLAAIIAATATLCATFLQLRVALAREADARSRGQAISRRRSRLPMILVGIMLLAAAVGGFALSQWMGSSQRSAQADLQRELRDRVAELGAAVAALQGLAANPSQAAALAASAPPTAGAPLPAATAAPVAAAATVATTATAATAATTVAATTALPAAAGEPPPLASSAPPASGAPAATPILAQAPTP
jgi:hypothetical protein